MLDWHIMIAADVFRVLREALVVTKPARILALLLVIVCSGCSTLSPGTREKTSAAAAEHEKSKKAQLYQIYIGSSGELLHPDTQKAVADERSYITDIFDNFDRMSREIPGLQLTIFIHGGLNTFEKATERVNRVADQMIADRKYPLFISWDSGYPGNYSDHLLFIRRGLHASLLGPLSSPFVLIEDVTRSIVRIPASTYNVLFGQRATARFYDSSEERAASASLDSLLEADEFHIHYRRDYGRHSFKDNWSIVNPVKLFTAPLIDGFGTGAWDSMLRRTDLVLRKQQNFDGIAEERKNGKMETVPSPGTAAAQFFRRWEDRYTGAKENPPVLLVGHSMGTIIANNIVAKYPGINFAQIVYMAAATRLKDIEYVISPYLLANPRATFYSLSLNPYRDINEAHLYDAIPRGSLLIWIDQTLGDINSFQDRTAGYWFNMIRSANQVFADPDVRKRVHLTQFGIRDGSPQLHGDFGKCPFWREEFWTHVDYQRGASREATNCDAVPVR